MNILGMGTLEILVVLLLAFILLGPGRMAEAAKLLGKATRELRRISEELPDFTLNGDPSDGERPIVHRGGGPNPKVRGEGSEQDEAGNGPTSGEPGPVDFRRAQAETARDDADQPSRQGNP